MNALLNPPAEHASARLLAQMRMVATAASLRPTIGAAFADGAAARGMTLAQAEAAVKGLVFMVTTPAARTVDDATLIQLTDEFLSKVTAGEDQAEKPTAIASNILLAHLVAKEAESQTTNYVATTRQGQSWDSPRGLAMKAADALGAQIGLRMGLKMEPTMGRDMGEVTLSSIAMTLCHAHGMRPINGADAIRMAGQNTGSDFAFIITNGLSGVVAKGFQSAPPAIAQVASEMLAADYRQYNSVWLSGSAAPMLVIEGAPLNYVQISEKGELAPRLQDYAALYAISNQALVNDSAAMNLFADIGRKMVIGANAQFRTVLLAPLLANAGLGQIMTDGLTVFHATHGNTAATGGVLSVATLTAARVAMRRQVDKQGTLLAIEPNFILVPPDQETAAQQLVTQISATKSSDVNPFQNKLEVVTEPGLTNTTAWYLCGNPAQATGLQFSYLDGQSTPRVEMQMGWNILGMEMRMVWPLGAAFTETASWYRNAGA